MASKRPTKSKGKVKNLPVKSLTAKQTKSVKGGHDDESPKERRGR